jgi:O-antigen/teichoic acid export membrane protein
VESVRLFFNQFKAFKVLNSVTVRNVFALTSGTVLSQVLPILFFPVLSRLYTPADYGVLGLFMSISSLLMVVSNLQLNYAILMPKDHSEAVKILTSGCYIVLLFSIFTLLVIVFGAAAIASWLNSTELTLWLYFVPLTVFLTGINVQFSAWFNRHGKFKIISFSRIIASVITVVLSLSMHFLIKGAAGLVISYVMASLISFLYLYYSFRKEDTLAIISLKDVRSLLKAYRNFPLYTMPTELISNFSQQLPLFIFSTFSGPASVGLFNRSRQILALPINYISGSISEIYKQKSSEAYRNNRSSLRLLFLKTLGSLFLVSVVPFIVLVVFAPDLFAFFFGENWREAGVFTQCLGLMYFLKFVVSPLTFNFYLVGKQRLDFILHIVIILITSAALYIGFRVSPARDVFPLLLFAIAYGSMYVIYGLLSYQFTKLKDD